MASGACKFGEEAKKEILDEPDCSNSTIVEDCPTLHQAGAVVEVDSDSNTNAISVTYAISAKSRTSSRLAGSLA